MKHILTVYFIAMALFVATAIGMAIGGNADALTLLSW